MSLLSHYNNFLFNNLQFSTTLGLLQFHSRYQQKSKLNQSETVSQQASEEANAGANTPDSALQRLFEELRLVSVKSGTNVPLSV